MRNHTHTTRQVTCTCTVPIKTNINIRPSYTLYRYPACTHTHSQTHTHAHSWLAVAVGANVSWADTRCGPIEAWRLHIQRCRAVPEDTPLPPDTLRIVVEVTVLALRVEIDCFRGPGHAYWLLIGDCHGEGVLYTSIVYLFRFDDFEFSLRNDACLSVQKDEVIRGRMILPSLFFLL